MGESAHLVSGLVKTLQRASYAQIVGSVVTFLFVRWIIKGIHRVYFHQLAGFPGPKLAAFTRLPKNISIWNGTPHERIHALHEQYGEVVRIAPDELSFISPDAWRDIYGHGHGHGKGARGSVPPKNWTWYTGTSYGVSNMVEDEDSAEHARVRRIFKPAFSDRALKEQEPLFKKYVEQLVGNLSKVVREHPWTSVDMVKSYNYTTFNVMGDLTFGESLHMLDNSTYDPWVTAMFNSIKAWARSGLIHHYPIFKRIFMFFFSSTIEQKKFEHYQHSAERVSKRLNRGRASEGRDLWDLVTDSDETEKLSRAQMDSNSMLFMAAGTETTATLLSGLTYLLLTNPNAMERLSNEIRSAFAGRKDMPMEVIAGLPYLGACLKEGLRLYPPVPTGMPHLTPINGSTICGQYVPPGTGVSVPHYAMYRSARNFRDPLVFAPERWLGDERFVDDRKTALQPFSVGSRDCLGKNMAYHEMRLILTNVLQKFDMQLCPESAGWADQKTFILWEKPPLMVSLKETSQTQA
ncbi:hypothetical protein OPT61_g1560 [Boeremia exigua]|uniref:Uncharacterized protein n=1 Tax=Boeremia exigua TaxID=749465 RepID=A0ACC2IPN9_9PLEO|nr:hypothetical protein OPT61_g1560 [Boeremia exigua]